MNSMLKKAVTLAAVVTTLGLGVACGKSSNPSVNAATNETRKQASTTTTRKTSGTTMADHSATTAKSSSGTTGKSAGATTTKPSNHDVHGGTGAPKPKPIVIKTFKFMNLVALAGVEQVVDNQDDAPHTLTAKDKSFDTGTINAKSKGKLTVAKPGDYEVYCVIHPSMKGTLKVS
jgi:plastocyanin